MTAGGKKSLKGLWEKIFTDRQNAQCKKFCLLTFQNRSSD